MCASWNATSTHLWGFWLVYGPNETEPNKVLTSHVNLVKSHWNANFYQKMWTVLLDFEPNLFQIISMFLYKPIQLSSLCPHIRISETLIRFSDPSPKFKNLKEFKKDFIQPKTGSYLVFVEWWDGPTAWAKMQKIRILPSRSNFPSEIFATCFDSR